MNAAKRVGIAGPNDSQLVALAKVFLLPTGLMVAAWLGWLSHDRAISELRPTVAGLVVEMQKLTAAVQELIEKGSGR